VAVIEEDKVGGVCLNRGCIPSKSLIAGANLYHTMQHAADFGIKLAAPPEVDWPAMKARKDKIVGGLVKGIGQLFKSYGVKQYSGFASLASPKKIHIELTDESEIDIEAKNIIVATGSRPANIPAFPLDGVKVLSSDHLLELESLPETMLIIGAGVIGCEWAFMLGRLGVKVEMVEMMPRALPMEDEMSSRLIERELKKMKIKLHTDIKVEGLESSPSGQVNAVLSDGVKLEAEQVLVSIGRAFNTADMGLEKAGIKFNKNGSIKVNGQMRSNLKNVYAIGDVAGNSLLAYTAVAEGAVAVDNCLGQSKKMDYLSVPSVIFTQPEVASVGMTEAQAAEKQKLSVTRKPTNYWEFTLSARMPPK